MLTKRLAAAGRGESSIVVLSGEPGVGKTRLLTELADHAASIGWWVLVGQALDSEGMPPYFPFVEALQEYVRLCAVDDLRTQLGNSAPEIAVILPEIARRLPNLPASTRLEGEGERYRLFDSLCEFIDAIAGDQQSGLLLCLEDLQWADGSTLLLLEHLCRRLTNTRLLVLATYRHPELDLGGPLAHTLEQVTRQHAAQCIEIKGLDADGVRLMLAGLGAPDPPSNVVEAIYTETEGNPFFIHEVFDYLADQGRLFDPAGLWRSDLQISATDVPQSVRLVIGRRLDRLSTECRAVLDLAAVLGRTFDYELLCATSEMTEDAMLAVLEEAEAAQLLFSDDRRRLTFRHELIRQTLLGGLTALRQQQLHLHAARAMEQMHGATVDARLAEIAGHYRMAGGAADPAKLVEYLTRAGLRALDVRAYDESIQLFGEAIAGVRSQSTEDTPDVSGLADLHRNCGRAYIGLGKWAGARRQLEAALDLLPQAATEQRSALLIDLAVACRWDGDLNTGRRCAADARALAESLGRQDLQAGALASMALVEFSEGEIVRGSTSYRTAIERARDVDRSVTKTASAGYAHLLYLGAQHHQSIEHGFQAVSLARELSDMATLTFALGPLGLSLAAIGRYGEAEEAFAEARCVGSQYGIESYLARAISMSATPHLDLFDFAGALQIAEEASELGRDFNFVSARVSAAIDCLFIHLRSGEVGRALELLPVVRGLVANQVNAGGTWLHGWLWGLRLAQAEAEAAVARNDWREGVRLATGSIDASRGRMRPKYESAALATRAQALVALGRKREAVADLTAAADVARGPADPAMFVRVAAIALRIEPDASLATEAREHVGRVLSALSDSPLRQSFEDSEAVQLISRMRDSHSRRQAGPPRTLAGLSDRELDVLRLVASGKSNPQIAAELVISVNTVQRHVGSILNKTGLTNRTQAASYAHQTGILL